MTKKQIKTKKSATKTTGLIITIPSQTIGIDVSTKALRNRSNSVKYRFRKSISTEVVEIETRGCDEFSHKRYTITIEGKLISIHEDHIILADMLGRNCF